jgi:hypothetical protein
MLSTILLTGMPRNSKCAAIMEHYEHYGLCKSVIASSISEDHRTIPMSGRNQLRALREAKFAAEPVTKPPSLRNRLALQNLSLLRNSIRATNLTLGDRTVLNFAGLAARNLWKARSEHRSGGRDYKDFSS